MPRWNRVSTRKVRNAIQKVADDDNNGVMKVDEVEDGDLIIGEIEFTQMKPVS